MKYAFFPGCSLESTAWDFARSTRNVCRVLGIELEDIPDWVCCGSTPAHSTSASLAVALPVMSLQKAQVMGRPVLAACASCYSRLRTANHKIQNDPDERRRAERVTQRPYDGTVPVFHVLDVLVNHYGADAIRAKVTKPLGGLRVASYYGCLLTRPPEIVAFDEPEHPTAMDDLVSAIGGTPITWPYKTECCGASLAMTNGGAACRLGYRLMAMARDCGAECLAVACPLCQVNLDLRQTDLRAGHEDLPEIPVLYLTQLLGLSLGLSGKEVGLTALTVSAEGLLHRMEEQSAQRGAGCQPAGSRA